jgi:hypothetical protein
MVYIYCSNVHETPSVLLLMYVFSSFLNPEIATTPKPKLSKNYNLNIRVETVYSLYCVTLSQNLNIRVLIVYLNFSHPSDLQYAAHERLQMSFFQHSTVKHCNQRNVL